MSGLREAAQAVVDAWVDDESGMETFDPELIDRLAAALSARVARRGETVPIDLDEIEMRWASQWNESDDGEVRAWRDDVAALIDEVRRLRRVSNGYFEEMVRRTR